MWHEAKDRGHITTKWVKLSEQNVDEIRRRVAKIEERDELRDIERFVRGYRKEIPAYILAFRAKKGRA